MPVKALRLFTFAAEFSTEIRLHLDRALDVIVIDESISECRKIKTEYRADPGCLRKTDPF